MRRWRCRVRAPFILANHLSTTFDRADGDTDGRAPPRTDDGAASGADDEAAPGADGRADPVTDHVSVTHPTSLL